MFSSEELTMMLIPWGTLFITYMMKYLDTLIYISPVTGLLDYQNFLFDR